MAFNSRQIDLFQTFLSNTDEERDRLSNTIELWDALPKYTISRHEMNKLRSAEGYLPLLERHCKFKGQHLKVLIQPAKIQDDDGVVRDYYPSASEELVEEALRKIASDKFIPGGYFDEHVFSSGVMFSINQLREELSKRGHAKHHHEIIKSLHILAGSMIEIRTDNRDGSGEGFSKTNYVSGLSAASKKRLADDQDARWLAQFHPLVTHSIYSINYRQFDYHAMMTHSTQLARWLRRQISMKYNFASMVNSFEMLWSTIHRDSNLINYSRTRDSVAALDAAFDELAARGAIASYTKELRIGPRMKILDVRYVLHPSMSFVREMKASNKRTLILKGE